MGVYVVDKPLGLTSFDVVASARRALGTRRIGHTGTLDPLATGVLVLASDESTKLVQFLTGADKEYLAFVAFGAASATLDAEGPVLETTPISLDDLAAADLEGATRSLTGSQSQMPPAHSAVQVGGVRAYAAARAGKPLDLEPREVTVHELTLLDVLPDVTEAASLRFAPGAQGWQVSPEGRALELPPPLGAYPVALLRAVVSSGTYVRSLARDLGAILGLPAHLAGLARTRAGAFSLEGAVGLDGLARVRPLGDLEALDLPVRAIDAAEARAVRDGKRLPSEQVGLLALAHEGRLVAVAEGDGQALRVRRGWSS